MSELKGQMKLDELGQQVEWEQLEGYDEQGHLINPAMEDQAGRAPPPLCGEGEKAARLAVEINAIKAQTRGVLISAALEIGKRLIEAKLLVPHGRWCAWLAENVDYSERRAQDMMRLYEEYGKKTIPQAIADLDYTKAVALLALPEEQREGLAEAVAAEGLSSRELQAEIEKLKAEAAARQVRLDELLEQADAAEGAIRQEREAADRARSEAKAAGDTAEALKKERDEAKKSRDLEIRKAQEAVKRANDTQRKLTEAEKLIGELEAAEPQVREVERVPDDVAEELARLRAAAGRSDAETRLRLGYERLLKEFETVEGLLAAVREADAETGAKYAAAIAKAARMMAERIEG